ncbi:hypothetical protein X748_09050 [Mesorhizobium sp. LNJC386A00]|nr:hypothetical protein X752_09885 [Mesorhizobium sp. LNJC398B00]ESY37749.1 hypothetical protein X748_09050 [Mesorhizobium sp. LNJC386A00]
MFEDVVCYGLIGKVGGPARRQLLGDHRLPYETRFEDLEYLTTGRTDLVSALINNAYTSIPIPHSFVFLLVLAAVRSFCTVPPSDDISTP